MNNGKKWLALWPTKDGIEILKGAGTLRDDLHLTCYYSPIGQRFDIWSQVNTSCVIIGIEYWENAGVVVALCEFKDNKSHDLAELYDSNFGRQVLPHNPHITLGVEMKDEYNNLIGKHIYFDKFGSERC